MACPGSLKQPNQRLNPPTTTKWAGLLHGPSISTRLRMRNGPKLTGLKVIVILPVSFNPNRTIHCSQAPTSQLWVWCYGLMKWELQQQRRKRRRRKRRRKRRRRKRRRRKKRRRKRRRRKRRRRKRRRRKRRRRKRRRRKRRR